AVLQQPVRIVGAGPQAGDRQFDRPGPGVPLPAAVAIAGVGPLRCDLSIAGPADLLDLGVHHPLGHLADHRPQHVWARRRQGLVEVVSGSGHNVVHGHLLVVLLLIRISKDHEVAVSVHRDTPSRARTVMNGQGSAHTPLPWTLTIFLWAGVRGLWAGVRGLWAGVRGLWAGVRGFPG